MDEPAWLEADVATDFFMVLPMDTSMARVRTDVSMTYDDQNLYLIATCYHLLPGRYFVESLRRDFAFGKNDNFLLFMDTFDDQTNGFSFGANAAGAQWDGLMYEGGKVDLSWDNKWTSVVKKDEDKWVFEASIPFKTIRYKKGITEWGINFSRLDLKTTEKSSWAPVPRQFPTASLAYTGILSWDAPPPEAGSNISLIPYALGGVSKDAQSDASTSYRREPVETATAWAAAAPASTVENLYGPTELTVACTVYRWDAERSLSESELGVVPLGHPLPGMQALVVDEALAEVAPGDTGELLMSGPQQTPGYWAARGRRPPHRVQACRSALLARRAPPRSRPCSRRRRGPSGS
jgi:hypothetical protein